MRSWVRSVPWLLFSLSLVLLFGSLTARRGETLPLYAARNGLLCQSCHFDPNGGGPRNDFGFMFARNRHSVEADSTGAWKDLELTNKIGDTMPVYIGVNQRFMLITNTSIHSDSLDRFGFFEKLNGLSGILLRECNGGLQFKSAESEKWWGKVFDTVTAFVGQQRGAIRCVSGVCRQFPPFEGARLELVSRF